MICLVFKILSFLISAFFVHNEEFGLKEQLLIKIIKIISLSKFFTKNLYLVFFVTLP